MTSKLTEIRFNVTVSDGVFKLRLRIRVRVLVALLAAVTSSPVLVGAIESLMK
jgi:hypothetical protein